MYGTYFLVCPIFLQSDIFHKLVKIVYKHNKSYTQENASKHFMNYINKFEENVEKTIIKKILHALNTPPNTL